MIKYPFKGLIIANGGGDWNFDLLAQDTPFTYAAFNIIPEHLLQEYLDKGCTIKSPLIYPEWEPSTDCLPIL